MFNALILISLIIIILILVFQHFVKIEIKDEKTYQPPPIMPQAMVPPVMPVNPLREYDRRALNDPLVAPLRRDDYNIPVIPVPTRGLPTAYKKVGTLIDKSASNDDPYKFLFLMGRRKYLGSDYYEYYVTETKDDRKLKFTIPHIHKELFDGDTVTVHELGKTYEVKADKELGFEYNPYVM